MALIELHPDLTRLTRAAERIASSLEQLVLAAYGLAPAPSKTVLPSKPTTDDDVSYATNESTLRQEVESIVMPGTVRQRDGDIVEEEVGDVLGANRRA